MNADTVRGTGSGGRVVVLADGGPVSLVACGVARERGGGAILTVAHSAAGRAMADRLGLAVLEAAALTDADQAGGLRGDGERESIELLRRVYAAARAGFDEVLWPVSAAEGDALDLDRIAECTDRAVLVSRLVALDVSSANGGHGRPGITLRCPYVDLTDRQIADLIVDMDLPVETIWWWGGEAGTAAGSGDAKALRDRWMPALERAGVRAG